MLDFFKSKNKVQAYDIRQISPNDLELLGVSQINPCCDKRFENNIFFTLVTFAFETRKYDEREGIVLAEYFSLRACPKCKKIQLIPSKIRINCDKVYLRHEEEIAFDAYEENPPLRRTSSIINAYCSKCSTCFEIKIKNSDLWVKEAKKLTEKDLVGYWEEYEVN